MMRSRRSLLVLLFAMPAVVAGQPALDRLRRMPPKDRQRALQKLPPDRARAAKNRLDRLDWMPPEERARLEDEYRRFQRLPPERKQAMRSAFRAFNQLPADRRRAVRAEFDSLRRLNADDRAKRFDAEEFRSQFSESERKLLRDMSMM